MSQPLSIGFSDAMRRLGFKGSLVPAMDPSVGVVPVMIMSDLSRSLSSEVFEARAIAGLAITGVVGNEAKLQIQSRAPGGIVIEFFAAFYPFGSTTDVIRLRRSGSPFAFNIVGGTAPTTELGGPAVLSQVDWGYVLAGTMVGTTAIPNLGVQLGGRWFVEPGETLEIAGSPDNTPFNVALQWRELSSIQGDP